MVKQQSLFYATDAVLICMLLMAAMYVMVMWGLWLRRRTTKKIEYLGALEGSSFGLLGLITAFTFSMAVARYDIRRQVVIDEANNIHAAISRMAMLNNDSLAKFFYADLKELIQCRMITNKAKVFESRYDSARKASYLVNLRMMKRANQLSSQNPRVAYAAEQINLLFLRINDSITLRYNVMNATVPEPIFFLLFAFALACSVFSGFSIDTSKAINWIPVFAYILFTGMVVYLILDIDRPKRGLVDLSFQYDRITDLMQFLPKGT